MTAIVIAGSAKQIECADPTPAWQVYDANNFNAAWNLALTRLDNIFILSAKYGLLWFNDLILPYKQKMSATRAKAIAPHVAAIWPEEGAWHLLPQSYLKAVPTARATALLPAGKKAGEAIKIMSSWTLEECLIDAEASPLGNVREPIPE